MKDQPSPVPGPLVTVMSYARPEDLARIRHMIARIAALAGLSPEPAAALQTAVNELASNTLRHTNQGGTVSAWTTGTELRVTVADSGHIGPQPQIATHDDPQAHRGLLLVGALCQQVSIRNHDSGATVHLIVPLPQTKPHSL